MITGSQFLYVKDRPKPEATLAGLKGGPIGKKQLLAQLWIAGNYYIAGNHWEYCLVQSFHVVVIKNDSITFTRFNNGNMFSQDVLQQFKTLIPGDKVSFINILGCENIDGGGHLKSLEFKIDE